MISRKYPSLLRLSAICVSWTLFCCAMSASAQEAASATPQSTCAVNQIVNGQTCTCAPGYFTSTSEESKSRCQDECEEVYFSYFTTGECVKGLFDRLSKDKQPACNLRCGMRVKRWASFAAFAVIAAAIATLAFTIPMCLTTCISCLHSRKASKHSKRVYTEQQQPNKETQMQTISYNPYAYWPYYGRA